MNKLAAHLFGLVRILLGSIFLWAFVDKLFGLGFATASGKSWLDGVSPTAGFLKFGTRGPLAEFFQGLAGQPWVDWLFMMGLLLIGLALVLGVAMHIACGMGALLMAFMFLALLPPEHHPVVDEHVIYAVTLLALAAANAGDAWGLGKRWKKLPLVKRFSWLS